jgi:hypothetical protein
MRRPRLSASTGAAEAIGVELDPDRLRLQLAAIQHLDQRALLPGVRTPAGERLGQGTAIMPTSARRPKSQTPRRRHNRRVGIVLSVVPLTPRSPGPEYLSQMHLAADGRPLVAACYVVRDRQLLMVRPRFPRRRPRWT